MRRDGQGGKAATLWKLFVSMLTISTFTFGGGFVIVTLMKRRFVDELGWLDENEMLDMTALAQSSPGAIAVNAAILVGRKVGGWAGMVCAVLGTLIPPMTILSLLSVIYKQFASNRYVAAMLSGMQAGVAAVILDVVLSLGKGVVAQRSVLALILMAASFVAAYVFKVNVVYVILLCAGVGVIKAVWQKRRKAA